MDDDGWLLNPEQITAGAQVTTVSRIDTALLFANLLGERTREVFTDQTIENLQTSFNEIELPISVRLNAAAALVLAGENPSQAQRNLARQAMNEYGSKVTLDTLPDYLNDASAATIIEPGIRLAKLISFDPGSNPVDQKIAASALVDVHLFANQEEVSEMFPRLQAEMLTWIRGKAKSVDQFIYAAAALPNSSVVQLTQDDLKSISREKDSWKKCPGYPGFVLVSKTQDLGCSLNMTVIAQKAA